MNIHERCSQLLPDYAAGSLSEEEADTFETHLLACQSCCDELEQALAVRAVLTRHQNRLRHLVRKADGGRRSTRWSISQLWPSGPRPVWSLAGPALAALLLALLYPAYLGLVKLPSMRDTTARKDVELGSLRQQEQGLRASLETAEKRLKALDSGGTVEFLELASELRGANQPRSVRLRPGQGSLLLLVPNSISAPAPEPGHEPTVEIVIRHLPDGGEAWRYVGPAVLSPETQQLMGIMVPTSALTTGEYRLERREPGTQAATFSATFRVEAPSSP